MGTSLNARNGILVGITLIAALAMVGCDREDIRPETGSPALSEAAQARLAQHVSSYQVLPYNHEAMYNALVNLPENAEADVVLPFEGMAQPVRLRLHRNGVVDNNFQGALWDGTRATPSGDLGLRTYDGWVVGGGVTAITLTPTTISGFAEVNGQNWVIEPAQAYDPGQRNMAIAYREAGMMQRAGGAFCGLPSELPTATLRTGPASPEPSALGPARCWRVDVLAHGDYQHLQYYGGAYKNALAALASAVNNASTRLKPAKIKLYLPSGNAVQNTASDNYGMDAQLLLNNVRLADNAAFAGKVRDLTLFITGRDLTLNGTNAVAGMCYPSVVCNNPTYSYLTAECFQGVFNARILAHEICHTLGAVHEDPCVQSLMYPQYSTTCSSDYPSTFTCGQVDSYTTSNSACLVWGGC